MWTFNHSNDHLIIWDRRQQAKQSKMFHVYAKESKYQLRHPVATVRASIREEKIGSKKSARFTKGRGVAKFIWSMPLYGGNTNQKGASLSVKVELS